MNLRDHLRERPCPVCGSRDQSRVAHPARFDEAELGEFAFASRKLPEYMHLRLLECPVCEVIYASPALTAEFLAGAYEDAAYDSAAEANHAARTYAGLLPGIVRSLPATRAALEVGAGNGAFLRELQRAGFARVEGVEPSTSAAAAAPAELRPLIRLGVFRPSAHPPASFDLVTCFQTLEHLEDPRAFCEAAGTLLAPGGALCVVVHDYHSWVTRLLGRRSPIFDVEHQQLFTRRSLRHLFEACGYERIEIRSLRNRYPLSYWVRLLPLPSALKSAARSVLAATGLGRLMISINLGNLGVTGYRPSGTGAVERAA